MTTRTAPKPTEEAVARYQGRFFNYPIGNMEFRIYVHEVRNRFGHVDVRIAPEAGLGSDWIQADRLGAEVTI